MTARRTAGRVGCGGPGWILFFPLRLLETLMLQEGEAIMVMSACLCRPCHDRPSK